MIKPNMPNMPNIPGMGAMTETLDFVKNLWAGMGIPGMNMPGMNVPGMVMPTLSVEEINKKITDLKAVESWLTLNMNMLRGTIQALEVQSATISALQSMGESFTASMTPPAPREQAQEMPAASAASPNGAETAEGHGQLHSVPEPTSKDQSDAANLTAPLVNAAAWWNMLQNQFQQAVNSAMSSEAPLAASAAAKPKPKAKSASPTSGTPAGTASAPRKRKTAK